MRICSVKFIYIPVALGNGLAFSRGTFLHWSCTKAKGWEQKSWGKKAEDLSEAIFIFLKRNSGMPEQKEKEKEQKTPKK